MMEDFKRVLAALRYTNAQLSAIVASIDYPGMYNAEGTLTASRETLKRVNAFQMQMLDRHGLEPQGLPAYNWDAGMTEEPETMTTKETN